MLKSIPTIAHLSRMYFELAKIGAFCVGADKAWPYSIKTKEELIALACDMSRFDPRLFDILVGWFLDHWAELNPVLLRNYYKKMRSPETVAVICEFMRGASNDCESITFADYLVAGLRPAAQQFYFHDLYAPGGKLSRRAVEEGLYEFKKWGFFACESPTLNLRDRSSGGSLDAISRRNILHRILQEKGEVGLKDYLSMVKNSISRQQALIDIKSSGLAQRTGKGRGARWKLAA